MNNKVLLISSNSSSRGGGERYLVFLTKGLSELGCEVHVLLSDKKYMDGWSHDIALSGGHVHRLSLTSLKDRPFRFLNSINDKKQINVIESFCKKISPDAILINQQYDEDGLDFLKGAMQSGISSVAGVMHMPMTKFKNKRFLGRIRGMILSRWYLKNPYKLIFVSEGSQDEFESYYKAPRPTFVVNNAIPLNNALSFKNHKKAIFQNNDPVIGFSGQFVNQKNLDCLVYAWVASLKKGVKSNLLLVGDGPERQKIEEFLKGNAPRESWFITGWTKSPEKYLYEIDLFVLTSFFEGMPLSLIEAVARGIPALITPFNGAYDISKHAAWVFMTKNNSLEEVELMMTHILFNLKKIKLLANEGVNEFRDYFSLRRMALDILSILQLKT